MYGARAPVLMRLVRLLSFTAASHNFTVTLEHIRGTDNSIADALSRFQVHRVCRLASEADEEPTTIPVIEMSS